MGVTQRECDVAAVGSIQAEVYILEAKVRAAEVSMGRCRRDAESMQQRRPVREAHLANAEHFRMLWTQYKEELYQIRHVLAIFCEKIS